MAIRKELRAIISADARKFNRTMAAVKRRVISTGKLLAGVVIAAGVFSVKKFRDFNDQMAEVQTIGKFSEAQLKKISQEVRDMAVEFGVATDELTGGLYEALSRGVPGEDAIEFLQIAAKAATAGVTDTKTAVVGITAVMNAYGLEAKDAQRISDVLFETVKLGGTTFPLLSTNIGKVATIAKAAGVEFEELAAFAAVVTQTGLETSVAFTAIRGGLTAMLSPSDAMKKRFKELGVSGSEALIKQLGLAGAMNKLAESTDGSASAIKELFGNIEGLPAVLSATSDEGAKVGEVLLKMRNAAGSTDEAFDVIQATMGKSMDKAVASLKELALVMGTELAPSVSKFSESIKEFATSRDTIEGVVAISEAFVIMGKVISGVLANVNSDIKLRVQGFEKAFAIVIKLAERLGLVKVPGLRAGEAPTKEEIASFRRTGGAGIETGGAGSVTTAAVGAARGIVLGAQKAGITTPAGAALLFTEQTGGLLAELIKIKEVLIGQLPD